MLGVFYKLRKVQITSLFCTWGRSSDRGPSSRRSRAQDGSIYHTFHTEPIPARPCRHRHWSFGKFRNKNRSTSYLWSFCDRVHKYLLLICWAASFCANGSAVLDQGQVKMRRIKSCSTERRLEVRFRKEGNSNLAVLLRGSLRAIIWENFWKSSGWTTFFSFLSLHLLATSHATISFKSRYSGNQGDHARFRDGFTFCRAIQTFFTAPSTPSCFVRSYPFFPAYGPLCPDN